MRRVDKRSRRLLRSVLALFAGAVRKRREITGTIRKTQHEKGPLPGGTARFPGQEQGIFAGQTTVSAAAPDDRPVEHPFRVTGQRRAVRKAPFHLGRPTCGRSRRSQPVHPPTQLVIARKAPFRVAMPRSPARSRSWRRSPWRSVRGSGAGRTGTPARGLRLSAVPWAPGVPELPGREPRGPRPPRARARTRAGARRSGTTPARLRTGPRHRQLRGTDRHHVPPRNPHKRTGDAGKRHNAALTCLVRRRARLACNPWRGHGDTRERAGGDARELVRARRAPRRLACRAGTATSSSGRAG